MRALYALTLATGCMIPVEPLTPEQEEIVEHSIERGKDLQPCIEDLAKRTKPHRVFNAEGETGAQNFTVSFRKAQRLLRAYFDAGRIYGFTERDEEFGKATTAFYDTRRDIIAYRTPAFEYNHTWDAEVDPGIGVHEAAHIFSDGHKKEVEEMLSYQERRLQTIIEHKDFPYLVSELYKLQEVRDAEWTVILWSYREDGQILSQEEICAIHEQNQIPKDEWVVLQKDYLHSLISPLHKLPIASDNTAAILQNDACPLGDEVYDMIQTQIEYEARKRLCIE